MIPILFESTETSFSTNGIGRLSDAISCIVTEERNGPYELEMQYPITGQYFSELQHSRIIFAVPADGKAGQPFRIYRIEKPLNGICTIYAEHISYELNHIPVTPFTASTCSEALNGLVSHSGQTNPFTVWTNKSVTANYTLKEPKPFRALLGGVEGSILDIYGTGEYEFDKYLVRLYVNRGTDSGVTIRYAKNLTELVNDENIEETYTGVCPYWYSSEDNVLVMLPEIAIWAPTAANFPYKRTKIVDFTDDFETQPTVAQLRARTNAYIEANNIGIPKVSIDVSFVPLWQTEGASLGSPQFDLVIPGRVEGDTLVDVAGRVEGDTVYLDDAYFEVSFNDYKILERIHLCDTVTIRYDALGVSHKAKVIKTVFDVLRDRYESIEVGEAKTTLASIVTDIDSDISRVEAESAGDEITQRLIEYVDHQTELITGGLGGYVIIGLNANDEPEEILVMDTADKATATNVIRINKNGIGFSRTGYSGPFTSAWTIDGVFNTDFIGAGSITGTQIAANTITASNIAANAITAGKIASGAVTADKLDAGAVTAGKIASGAITVTKLGSDVSGQISTAQTTADNAQTTANNAASAAAANPKTYRQASEPTGKAGDIWVDSDDNNKMYRHNGTSWVSIRDGTIATAQSTASSAASLAADLDALMDDLTKVDGNTTYIDGGKIYTGSITAGAIGAGAITTAKLAAGAVTAAKLSLYGKMGVYTSSGLGTNGGYIGYMSGSDGSTTTTGIGLMDTNSKNYVIVTDSGIRATNTSGSNKTEMYLANGVVAFTGTSFRAKGDVRLNYDGSSFSGTAYANELRLPNNKPISSTNADGSGSFWMLYSDSSNNTYLGNTGNGTIIRGTSVSIANNTAVNGNLDSTGVIRKYNGSNLIAYISISNNAGYLRLQDTSGNPIAALYKATAGNGALALYDTSGTAHYLTPSKIDAI